MLWIIFEVWFVATLMLTSLVVCKSQKKKKSNAPPPPGEPAPAPPPTVSLPAADSPKQDHKTQEQTNDNTPGADGEKKEEGGEKKKDDGEKEDEGDKSEKDDGEKEDGNISMPKSKKDASNANEKDGEGEGGGGEGVTVSSDELKWTDFPLDQTITIKNSSGDRIAIKVKSSDNKLYNFDPSFLFVKDGESGTVKISRAAAPPKPDRIEIVWLRAEEKDKKPEEVFKKANVKENVLVVKCIGKSIPPRMDAALEKNKEVVVVVNEVMVSKDKDEKEKEEKKEKSTEEDEEKKEEDQKKPAKDETDEKKEKKDSKEEKDGGGERGGEK